MTKGPRIPEAFRVPIEMSLMSYSIEAKVGISSDDLIFNESTSSP